MKSYILSIDQGTTSCRAIVFDKSGKTKGLGQKEFKQSFPKAGWVEHDAEEILATQIACIKDAIKDAGVKPDEIAAVGLTNQRETTVVWNKKTGKPVYPAIVWQCRRTQQLAEELREESNTFREKTGLVPDAYFSGPKIRWVLDNVKGARELADKGELAFGTIDTWLIWNLTKDKNHFTEPSNASRTMVYNIHTLEWDEELLSRLQIPISMMPKVIPSNSNFGETDQTIVGFSAPILADLGDQQAALFGQCCFEVGMGKCTYGTGSFLLTNIGTDAKLVPGLLTTVAWQLEGQPATYAFEGAIFVAGAAIQWLRDGLGIIESSAETQELAESIKSNDGVYFVPAFVGLGSPYWNSDVRGTITGLTRGSTKAHLARAALEAMAFQIADVAKGMAENGINVKELRVDGGVTRNNFMVQFQADLLKVPVIRSAQLESTAWGVGALAALTCGLVKDFAELSTDWQQDSKIVPCTDRSSDYEGWQSAVRGAFAVAIAKQ
ncbi:glycerol kinase GlpK [soil metagenome]